MINEAVIEMADDESGSQARLTILTRAKLKIECSSLSPVDRKYILRATSRNDIVRFFRPSSTIVFERLNVAIRLKQAL